VRIPVFARVLASIPIVGASAVAALGGGSTPTAAMPFHVEPRGIRVGPFATEPDAPPQEFFVFLQVEGAAWLRASLGAASLGERSAIRVTSLLDGATQRLDARSLATHAGWTAFFNGDALQVVVEVAPGDRDVGLTIDRLAVGEWMPGDEPRAVGMPGGVDRSTVRGNLIAGWRGSEIGASTATGPGPDDDCGEDTRLASTDPAVGRLSPVGCTGWIASNGAHLTAGHCASFTIPPVLEFQVPPSLCNGTPVFADPDDQYPVLIESIVATTTAIGNDWAVYACGPNANTGRLPVHAQAAFLRPSRPLGGTTTTLTGYGTDATPPGCTGGNNAQSQTQQSDTGPWMGEIVFGAENVEVDYACDSGVGSSGSPPIDAGFGVALGVHTAGQCALFGYNAGTGFENDLLEAALASFSGVGAVHVDASHPALGEDGSVLEPFDTLAEGVAAVAPGGDVILVAGSYDETASIAKPLTLRAPVGPVTIGR